MTDVPFNEGSAITTVRGPTEVSVWLQGSSKELNVMLDGAKANDGFRVILDPKEKTVQIANYSDKANPKLEQVVYTLTPEQSAPHYERIKAAYSKAREVKEGEKFPVLTGAEAENIQNAVEALRAVVKPDGKGGAIIRK